MQRTAKYTSLLLAAAAVLPLCAAPANSASLAGQVLKGAAVGYAVTRVAGPIDSFINTVTLRHGMQTRMATKVVPILSVGEKGYVGGAQVSGPSTYVSKVQAVFQYEKQVSNNNYRAKVLLPSASLNPLKLERVPQVGVTAIIDVALAGDQRYRTVGTGIKTGDVIRGAAVLVAVKNLGSGINSALNTITLNTANGYTTRVVPMGSVGEKMYLGAAQISASTRTINQVNALWQYEDVFSSGQYRVRIMVPTTSSNPLQMKRVDGAGVTAVVDMALSQQKDIPQRNSRTWESIRESAKKRAEADAKARERERKLEEQKRKEAEKKRDSDGRKDNGRHLGWEIGKHKGWDKKD